MTPEQVIEKLSQHEEFLSQLYQTYSEYQPNREFWIKMMDEEKKHANLIRSFRSQINSDRVFINEKRFKIPVIEFSMRHIEEKIQEAKNKKIELAQALIISLDIENALLEKRYFEIFEGDSIELKHKLEAMEKSIKEHIVFVQKELNKIKAAN